MPQTADRSAFESLADGDAGLTFQLRNEVAGLAASGMSIIQASKLVGIPVPDRLPTDPPYTPTPGQIREHCFAIQSAWTFFEWRSREAMGGDEPVETHTVRIRDLGKL